jgi:methionyl-tRNA formyltransferase
LLTPTPVSVAAQEHGLPLFRYEKIRPPEVLAELRSFEADVFVVAAYGRIIPQSILDLPRVAPVNLHGSLLPKYRGASPIQAAIAAGEPVTGISLMQMDAEMDHGPVYAMIETPIAPTDTFETLEAKLADAAAALLVEKLPKIIDGTLAPTEQDHSLATPTRLIKKEDGRIDPVAMSATEIERRLRAYTPWPGAYLEWQRGDEMLHVKLTAVQVADMPALAPGAHGMTADGFPALGTRQGTLVLKEVQPPGKKPMDGKAFLNGYADFLK